MRRLGAGLAVVAALSGAAVADRREASLHAHLIGGLATSADPDAAASASAPLGGLGIRASHATHDRFQYDASLSLLGTVGGEFDFGSFMSPGRPGAAGPFTVPTQVTRLDAGVTLRLGVELIPTIRVAAGVQGRRRGSPTVTTPGGDIDGVRASDLGMDLVTAAAVGLDYRVNRRLVVGLAAGGSYAVPLGGEAFRTLELTVHVARYAYPRW